VARSWDLPAVVGAGELVVGADAVRDTAGEVVFAAGDVARGLPEPAVLAEALR